MKKRRRAEKDAVEAIVNEGPSFTDPQGSWTGKPEDAHEPPDDFRKSSEAARFLYFSAAIALASAA